MFYQCCDCGEIKATKSGLEAHLNSDHLGWTPYQCFYCSQQGVSTRKHNKELLREHMAQRHPDEEFTFLCTDDQNKKERLKDMLRRSTSFVHSPDVTRETPVSVTASPDEKASPFVISFSDSPFPQPKDEVMDIEELAYSPITGAIETSTETAEHHIKPNLSVLGNCRCETCHESVPRNLVFIRDHVKLHFKEKTGCLPADLTNLLPNLQLIYCQLLMTSFPSVSASMLDDDIPNCNEICKTTNRKETEQRGVRKPIDNVEYLGQFSFDNDADLFDNDSLSDDNSASNGRHCNECGAKFRRLASLKTHLARYCKRDHVKEDPKLSSTRIVTTDTTGAHYHKPQSPFPLVVSCDVCSQKFLSTWSLYQHRAKKHGICVQWHCTECKLDFKSSSGGGFPSHLLRVHMVKRPYECSLCETSVNPGKIVLHDKQFHGGLGKALIVNNLHRYKDQVEQLRRKLIIDRNSSLSGNEKLANGWKIRLLQKFPLRNNSSVQRKLKSTSKKRSARARKQFATRISSESTKDVAKFEWPLIGGKISQEDLGNAEILMDVKAKKSDPHLSCEICNKRFSSMSRVKLHRAGKHGILVKWHCKECNLQIHDVTKHLLTVHLGKKSSVCSLCDAYTYKRKLTFHNRSHHNGSKARVINNADRYKKELEALRKTLIVDVNAIVNTGDFVEETNFSPRDLQRTTEVVNPVIPQLKNDQQLMTDLKRPVASDSLKWLLRFKRSQKRKLKQRDKLKRFGDMHSTMQPELN